MGTCTKCSKKENLFKRQKLALITQTVADLLEAKNRHNGKINVDFILNVLKESVKYFYNEDLTIEEADIEGERGFTVSCMGEELISFVAVTTTREEHMKSVISDLDSSNFPDEIKEKIKELFTIMDEKLR